MIPRSPVALSEISPKKLRCHLTISGIAYHTKRACDNCDRPIEVRMNMSPLGMMSSTGMWGDKNERDFCGENITLRQRIAMKYQL